MTFHRIRMFSSAVVISCMWEICTGHTEILHIARPVQMAFVEPLSCRHLGTGAWLPIHTGKSGTETWMRLWNMQFCSIAASCHVIYSSALGLPSALERSLWGEGGVEVRWWRGSLSSVSQPGASLFLQVSQNEDRLVIIQVRIMCLGFHVQGYKFSHN